VLGVVTDKTVSCNNTFCRQKVSLPASSTANSLITFFQEKCQILLISITQYKN